MGLFIPYSNLSGQGYTFREDPLSASLVYASAGFSNYEDMQETKGLGLLPWSDVSPFIRGNGDAKNVNTSSIGLYQSSSLEKFDWYDGSTFVSGSGYTTFSSYSADFNFGGDPFTIETWVNFGELGSVNKTIAFKANEYEFMVYKKNSLPPSPPGIGIRLVWYSPTPCPTAPITGIRFLETITTIPLNEPNGWHHIALVRYPFAQNAIALYFDGQRRDSGIGFCPSNTNTNPLNILGIYNNENDAYFQDYRIYKGVAKYQEFFYTPPLSMIAP
jgi:hypothetical protein